MAFRRVTPGQPFRPSATVQNALIDKANEVNEGRGLSTAPADRHFVTVRNTLGRNLDAYAAVLIGYWNALPTGRNEFAFPLINPSLRNQYVMGAARSAVIGILPAPIPAGRVGRAQISGIAIARFNQRERPTGTPQPTPFADLSDLTDTLVLSQFGPLRYLSRNTGHSGGSSLQPLGQVMLGEPYSLGTATMVFTTNAWSSSPNNTPLTLQNVSGDGRAVGLLFPTDGGTVVTIRRNGRYAIRVSWSALAAPATYANRADTLEYREFWQVPFTTSTITHGGAVNAQLLNTMGYPHVFSGQRDFVLGSQIGISEHVTDIQIPIPGIQMFAVRVAGNLALAATGEVTVDVWYLGPQTFGNQWSAAQANAIWARSTTAGPINPDGSAIAGEEAPPLIP